MDNSVLSVGNDGKLKDMLEKQGWHNPLSMKTQETSVERDWKNPRMAMGLTTDNQFFTIAYDGRQKDSVGVNLLEMIEIAEEKVGKGKVRSLLNLDSGASVSMSFVDSEGRFVTMNTPTEVPGTSATGQLRAVNSMFVITTPEAVGLSTEALCETYKDLQKASGQI